MKEKRIIKKVYTVPKRVYYSLIPPCINVDERDILKRGKTCFRVCEDSLSKNGSETLYIFDPDDELFRPSEVPDESGFFIPVYLQKLRDEITEEDREFVDFFDYVVGIGENEVSILNVCNKGSNISLPNLLHIVSELKIESNYRILANIEASLSEIDLNYPTGGEIIKIGNFILLPFFKSPSTIKVFIPIEYKENLCEIVPELGLNTLYEYLNTMTLQNLVASIINCEFFQSNLEYSLVPISKLLKSVNDKAKYVNTYIAYDHLYLQKEVFEPIYTNRFAGEFFFYKYDCYKLDSDNFTLLFKMKSEPLRLFATNLYSRSILSDFRLLHRRRILNSFLKYLFTKAEVRSDNNFSIPTDFYSSKLGDIVPSLHLKNNVNTIDFQVGKHSLALNPVDVTSSLTFGPLTLEIDSTTILNTREIGAHTYWKGVEINLPVDTRYSMYAFEGSKVSNTRNLDPDYGTIRNLPIYLGSSYYCAYPLKVSRGNENHFLSLRYCYLHENVLCDMLNYLEELEPLAEYGFSEFIDILKVAKKFLDKPKPTKSDCKELAKYIDFSVTTWDSGGNYFSNNKLCDNYMIYSGKFTFINKLIIDRLPVNAYTKNKIFSRDEMSFVIKKIPADKPSYYGEDDFVKSAFEQIAQLLVVSTSKIKSINIKFE